ncbi:Sterol 24-C-methyltransferase [Hondaea fermentalgiana]|uniref:Sterol 24-C-methyltransferase n=1 Tax=Hondaea fermentalgiana TaxID=2315210 RepID=A0A2R5GLN7_9STRA|nr:Sterol 24-C-methyltransferase [Hondaea fermentalgiana]|eukprot:GBG31790.1 Sterol 24-C-methyltransferase [Hondaea fermentalgiana]
MGAAWSAAQAWAAQSLGLGSAAGPGAAGQVVGRHGGEEEDEEERGLAQYKDPDFHARLRKDWPEDGEQLHSGGWAMTKKLMEDVERWLEEKAIAAPDARLLDLCCGEGSTPIYYAKERGWDSVGIDISETAIAAARAAASKANVQDKATFVVGSAFKLPFQAEAFDVIYGQDPDALSLPQRPACFRDCLRTLRSGGILAFHHHWIPGPGWDESTLKQYCAESGSDEVHADQYVQDLEAAGFRVEVAESISALASSHLHGQLERMKARVANEGGVVQPWLVKTCEYIDKGHAFGVRIVARKP